MSSILLNDLVQVTVGKDKGKTGKVLKILKNLDPNKTRVIVEGINKVTKHVKGTQGQPGQRIVKESSIHISNIQVLCPKTKKPSRIGYVVSDNGSKSRVAKVSGEVLPSNWTKK